VRIWTAGLENVPGIVGLSDALFREADGCRDPATNLESALQEGRRRVVRRAPSRRCDRLLAGVASSRWGCHRVPGGPPVRSGLPSDGEGGDAGEHVCPRGSGDTARERGWQAREVVAPAHGSRHSRRSLTYATLARTSRQKAGASGSGAGVVEEGKRASTSPPSMRDRARGDRGRRRGGQSRGRCAPRKRRRLARREISA